MVCVYNGKKGAYAEQAVEEYFGGKAETIAVTGFPEIFKFVLEGKADFGMVPIENTTAGSVYQNYDNFIRFEKAYIVGAVTLKIKHALLAPKGATFDTIKNIYSHPQARDQSSEFLEAHKNWSVREAVSTAGAAAIVAENGSLENGAIANARNAALYNLEILKDGIQNNENNFTRFVVICNEDKIREGQVKVERPNRASIVFSTKNEPGMLYDCLGVLKNLGINMNRLESRPIPSDPWKYRFYTDIVIDENRAYEQIDDVKREMGPYTMDLRILGVYKE